jgi:nucleoside-diphosphate kinase
MLEKTLSILKPDAVRLGNSGGIISYIEKANMKIIAMKMLQLSKKQAEEFYSIHKDRPFFVDLVNFMISGTVIVQVLIGENAVIRYRDLMGHTDPQKATKGTIRADFAKSIEENCVHGSDSLENAKKEISFFFAEYEILQHN